MDTSRHGELFQGLSFQGPLEELAEERTKSHKTLPVIVKAPHMSLELVHRCAKVLTDAAISHEDLKAMVCKIDVEGLASPCGAGAAGVEPWHGWNPSDQLRDHVVWRHRLGGP